MNEDLLTTVTTRAADRPFDTVFTYLSGEQVAPETVAALRGLGVPIINLSLNDKEGFVGRIRDGAATGVRDICRHFDLCWTSTLDAVEKYCVEGATPLYLPEGANPEVHRPYEVEKTLDVSFVGQCYGNRPGIVAALRDAGIRVEAFGPGWPSGPLSTEEMVRTYSRSRINLGFGGIAGHRETYCLKGRDFEVPMSGGLYLTEEYEELSLFYEVGKEIVTYRGIEDLLSKIRRLLANPGEAEAIRAAGRARALREHTWEMRFSKVLGILGIIHRQA
jgi:spore maturation protein CgeB